MFRLVAWPVAAIVIAIVAVIGLAPTALLAGPGDQKGDSGPDIAAFQSAQFDLNGFVKVDGITVDVSGTGSLAPPDKSAATYRLGPLTLETVTVGSNFYGRSRFDPSWETQEIPAGLPIYVGPLALSEVLPKGPYSIQAQERLDGRLITKWGTDLDLSLLVALAELSPSTDDTVSDALRSLKARLEVWVGNDDRQLYKERIVFTFTVPPIEPQGEPLPGSIDMTLMYSKHNQPVTIQAPSLEQPSRRSLSLPKLRTLIQSISAG
ncbi:MAG TPA: hypothetical protein VHX16_16735 [Chloroflexota bacterium]|nr:hypothetical protein [Chloroflexota bacterium]